jgi:hypothetical protein
MHLTEWKSPKAVLCWLFSLAFSMALVLPLRASEKGTITVRLLAPSPMICAGQQTLDLEAVLTNSSEEAVELSQDGVVHSISFEKYEKAKSTGSTGWLLDIQPGHWITIAPHQSVVVPFTEPITDKLFGAAGLFSARIEFAVLLKNPARYSMFPGSIPSNGTLFLLSDCKSDPTPAPSPLGGASGPAASTQLHESGHVDPPTSNLTVPGNGPTTCGGATQFQLQNPRPIDPTKFKPTNPQ